MSVLLITLLISQDGGQYSALVARIENRNRRSTDKGFEGGRSKSKVGEQSVKCYNCK